MSTKELKDRCYLGSHTVGYLPWGTNKISTQVQLFIDAISKTFSKDKVISTFKGREKISKAFDGFLKYLETVCYSN